MDEQLKGSLAEVEQQLSQLVSEDKKSWTKIYELMKGVNTLELYKPGYRTFTAWVNSFAERNKVHVSLLWARRDAGSFYEEYAARQRNQGKEFAPIQSIEVSPDSIALVKKIAGGDPTVADNLMRKVLNNDLTRKDLSNAWKTEKARRERAGVSVVRKNGYDKPISVFTDDQSDFLGNNDDGDKRALTEADIVLAFSQNSWLTHVDKPYVDEKYHIFTEFAVDTGTTHHARRMDILAVENLSTEKKGEVNLHGIEIKVSKYDLCNDHKMSEYRDFCDYFWVAIPEELLDTAKDVIVQGWGIITVSADGNLTIQEKAQKYDAVFREETITLALLKLL